MRLIALFACLAFVACSHAPSSPAPNCEAPARALAFGSAITGEMAATDEGYPANARYYCFRVPELVRSVSVRLTGLDADLDLYIGANTIASVQGSQLEHGRTYEWLSNRHGAADEQIVLSDAGGGLYYIEIVSYRGDASAFTLEVTVDGEAI